ncbi:hypothetical protein T11_13634, partial [Trichinella zimbabwensis]
LLLLQLHLIHSTNVAELNYNCKYLTLRENDNLQNYALTCTTESVEFFISALANVGS